MNNFSNETIYRMLWTRSLVGAFELIYFFIGVPLQVLVLYLCIRIYRRHGHKNQLLVLSMTMADLLFSSIHSPMMFGLFYHNIAYSLAPCYLLYFATYVGTISSSVSLLLLNIDKFINLRHPLHYQLIVTRRKTTTAIVICWVVSISWTCIFLLGPATKVSPRGCQFQPRQIGVYVAFFIIFFTLPILISFVLSIYIGVIVLRVQKSRRERQASMYGVKSSSNRNSSLLGNQVSMVGRRSTIFRNFPKLSTRCEVENGVLGSNLDNFEPSLKNRMSSRLRGFSFGKRSSADSGSKSKPRSINPNSSQIKCSIDGLHVNGVITDQEPLTGWEEIQQHSPLGKKDSMGQRSVPQNLKYSFKPEVEATCSYEVHCESARNSCGSVLSSWEQGLNQQTSMTSRFFKRVQNPQKKTIACPALISNNNHIDNTNNVCDDHNCNTEVIDGVNNKTYNTKQDSGTPHKMNNKGTCAENSNRVTETSNGISIHDNPCSNADQSSTISTSCHRLSVALATGPRPSKDSVSGSTLHRSIGRPSAHKLSRNKFGASIRSILFVFNTTIWAVVTVLPYRSFYIMHHTGILLPDNAELLIATMYLFILMVFNPVGNPIITICTQRSYVKLLKKIIFARLRCFKDGGRNRSASASWGGQHGASFHGNMRYRNSRAGSSSLKPAQENGFKPLKCHDPSLISSTPLRVLIVEPSIEDDNDDGCRHNNINDNKINYKQINHTSNYSLPHNVNNSNSAIGNSNHKAYSDDDTMRNMSHLTPSSNLHCVTNVGNHFGCSNAGCTFGNRRFLHPNDISYTSLPCDDTPHPNTSISHIPESCSIPNKIGRQSSSSNNLCDTCQFSKEICESVLQNRQRAANSKSTSYNSIAQSVGEESTGSWFRFPGWERFQSLLGTNSSLSPSSDKQGSSISDFDSPGASQISKSKVAQNFIPASNRQYRTSNSSVCSNQCRNVVTISRSFVNDTRDKQTSAATINVPANSDGFLTIIEPCDMTNNHCES